MKNLKLFFLLLFLSVSTVQAQTRSDIQVLIDNIATGVPNTALKVRTVLNAIANGSAQTGDVKEIDVNNAYIAANFDVTGLGIGERVGWAICNGNNGTRDRGGRVGVGYNNVYSTMGATGGASTHTLTINEIPTHSHQIYVNSGSGGAINGAEDAVSSGSQIPTSTAGGGQAHNNMQPYVVTLYIMKL